MKQAAMRWLCRFLIAAAALAPCSGAYAGMIGAGEAVSSSGASAERAAVAAVLERAEVASQLESSGIDTAAARARVAALTDEEVRLLSGRIAALPAGGSFFLAAAAAVAIAMYIVYRYR